MEMTSVVKKKMSFWGDFLIEKIQMKIVCAVKKAGIMGKKLVPRDDLFVSGARMAVEQKLSNQ
jgi:hypothetical protein